jgi:hypothetical protein
MAKIRIKAVPKMQTGGYPPITSQERDAWERMQSAAYQQGFYGSEHNRQPGVDFMRQQGIDPARLPAYQADFQNFASSDPSRIRYGQQGLSNADAFYGPKTAQQRYRKYQVFHNDKEVFAPSTDLEGSVNALNSLSTKANTGWENYGKPEANINYQAPETATTPMVSKPTGLAATGFPTREEAIAKYKARKASGQELPSNYFTGKGNADYSVDTVRSTGRGSDEYAYGGATRKIRITGVPTMANGGYANRSASHGYGNQQVGQGYALNRFWSSPAGYPGSTSQVNPYGRTGNTLPEAENGGDINAEKQEMILGDFDQDGQQELMNVDGPPHTEGGKDVNVPSNSFVFSDTKDLKIKDPQILAMFNMAPKRGGYTPAFIAKKYDLNKLKKILDDPNADELAKKTAQLMYDNYLAKLNKLAGVQEAMKAEMGMEHHDPNQAQQSQQEPPVQEAGNMGPGGENMMQPEVMFRYGGIPQYQRGGLSDPEYGANDSMGMSDEYVQNPDGSYSIPSTTAMSPQVANAMANQQVSQNIPAVYTSSLYPTSSFAPNDPSNYLTQAQQTQPQIFPGSTTGAGPITNVGMLSQNKPVNNKYDEMYRNILSEAQKNKKLKRGVDYGSDWISPTLAEPIMRAKGYTGPLSTSDYNNWVHGNNQAYQTLGTGPNATAFGLRDALYDPPVNLPVVNLPKDQIDRLELKVPPPLQDEYPVPWAGNRSTPPAVVTKEEEEKKKGKGAKQRMGIFANPNMYGDAMNLAQMLQLQKFVPYSPVPQAVIPPTVFMDPTRAIAAQQEMARNAMEMNNQSADSRAARANNLAAQGIAGTQAADIIGQYANQNVGIANQANANAAQITNQLMQMEGNRMEELNKGNFLAARDYQREMGRLQAEWADRKQKQHDTAVKKAWLNKTSPYFNIGMNDMPEFKPGNAEAAYWKEMKGGADPDFSEQIVQTMKKHGWTFEQALAALTKGTGSLKRQSVDPITGDKLTTSSPTSKYGGMMRYGGSHMAMPNMAPAYQIGGSFVPLAAGPDLPMPIIDNTAYNMPVQPVQQPISYSDTNPVEGMTSRKGSKRDIATTTNNPGNIIYKPLFNKLFGAVDSGIKQKDGNGYFAMFPDLATGLRAYQTQLFGEVDGTMKSDYYKKDTTVDEALRKWSGKKGYSGDIYPEIKNKKLSELTMAERNELTKRQIKHESGDMYKLLRQRGVFKYGGSALQKFIR